ncbi:MAG: hypothetical protein KA289_04850, partial [Kaistella sp.]|nr:hypothetical protein [Kaistella sp.]
ELPELEAKVTAMPEIQARNYLTDYSVNASEATNSAWRQLSEFLLVKFLDGNIKKEENGKFVKNEYGLPPTIIRAGYPEEIQREMVKENPGLRQKSQEELDKRK